MGTMLIATGIVCAVAAATGIGTDRALAERGGRMRTYRVFLVLSLVPYLLHLLWTTQLSAGWVDLERSVRPYGVYPGGAGFLGYGLLLGLLLLWPALASARRWPLLSGLLPAIAFTLYYHTAFGLLAWDAPGAVPVIDNVPMVWLFVVSAGYTMFLLLFAWLGVKRLPGDGWGSSIHHQNR